MLSALHCSEEWSGTVVGIASRTDEPAWAQVRFISTSTCRCGSIVNTTGLVCAWAPVRPQYSRETARGGVAHGYSSHDLWLQACLEQFTLPDGRGGTLPMKRAPSASNGSPATLDANRAATLRDSMRLHVTQARLQR